MELFIGIMWPVTVVAAFIAGYKLRKPIEATEDKAKAGIDQAKQTATSAVGAWKGVADAVKGVADQIKKG